MASTVTDGMNNSENANITASENAVAEPTANNEEATADNQEAQRQNEFSYLNRMEFTSEIYKVEVRNLGYFGIGEFKKLLKSKLKLDMSKIKSPNHKDFAFVCFRSAADQQRAVETLNGYKWKGKVLQATIAKASADPLQKRRNEAFEKSSDKNGSTPAKQQRTSADATAPLASMAYDKQLEQKTTEMQALLKTYTTQLERVNRSAKNAISEFKFTGVSAAPQINGYRNKNEFTVGKNAAGEIVVGFRLGSYADGSTEVSEISNLPHIPDAAKWAAHSFQEFVRQNCSKWMPFNPEANAGHFKQLMVRTSGKTGELMLVAGIYSSNLQAEELDELKHELKKFYECQTISEAFKCTSLYYQDFKPRIAGQMVSPVEHLWGTTHIVDSILDLDFRISPLAFFQINTQSANILYQKAIDLAAPEPHSTVLDICCGTGTIGLCFAKHCKQVLGVEIIAEAIDDANFNAEANSITNCKFYAGNADDYIQSMVKEVVYGAAPGEIVDLMAVVDPPRAGLHNRSIAAIRAASAIKRLVYISCNPNRALKNWIELGRPESKQYKGDPFFPKTAIAVDMFPHTTHTELVILFERNTKAAKQNQDNQVESNITTTNTVTDEIQHTDSSISAKER